MATDLTRLLDKLLPQQDGQDVLRLRTGIVTALNGDGTADITLSGVTVPSVPRLDDADIAVSDVVQILTYRGSLLIIGTTATAAPPAPVDNPNFWALVGTPTIANNTVTALTPTSWPLNEGGLYPGSGNVLTIPAGQGGVYDIGIYLRYASQATASGTRQARINAYGGDHAIYNVPGTSAFNASNITVGGVKRSFLAEGATIVFEAYQSSGVSLALVTDSSVWLERVG